MLKAFITDTQDVIRIPYSKKHSVFPRRTVFGASVNQAEFLSDMTGNRRWWCIPVKAIDNAHNLDIQQVWAEVYSMYEDGATWYPTDQENEIILKASWQFTFPDPIMDLILDKFDWIGYPNVPMAGMTATEVLKLCGMDKPTP
ncbi:MAG: virulence-associated E family protein, partial [Cloacibacillus sp.]|nr:virulence-associated E family protein [Cloacibacillus sp.]